MLSDYCSIIPKTKSRDYSTKISEPSANNCKIFSVWKKQAFTRFRKREKIIGYHVRRRESDDLPRARAKPKRKYRHFHNVHALIHALITRKFMRSEDAQYNTNE